MDTTGVSQAAEGAPTQHQMPAARRQAVQSAVGSVLRSLNGKLAARLKPRSVENRQRVIVQMYAELWALGYHMTQIESLAPRHLHALLANWQARGMSRETARPYWSHITMWCAALGKTGMAPDFAAMWPQTPPDGSVTQDGGDQAPDQPASGAAAKPTRIVALTALDLAAYANLLSVYRERRDQTHYWLVRCVRELGLSREEAILLRCPLRLEIERGVVEAACRRGRGARWVKLDSPEKRRLGQELRDFMVQRGAKRLGWTDLGLTQAMRRYSNALGYALGGLVEAGQMTARADEEAATTSDGGCVPTWSRWTAAAALHASMKGC